MFLVGLSLKLGFDGDFYAILALPMGLGVAAAWMPLLISGRWRPVHYKIIIINEPRVEHR
jgi:hypothetical protein